MTVVKIIVDIVGCWMLCAYHCQQLYLLHVRFVDRLVLCSMFILFVLWDMLL